MLGPLTLTPSTPPTLLLLPLPPPSIRPLPPSMPLPPCPHLCQLLLHGLHLLLSQVGAQQPHATVDVKPYTPRGHHGLQHSTRCVGDMI
jgi:hypothetical protein